MFVVPPTAVIVMPLRGANALTADITSVCPADKVTAEEATPWNEKSPSRVQVPLITIILNLITGGLSALLMMSEPEVSARVCILVLPEGNDMIKPF